MCGLITTGSGCLPPLVYPAIDIFSLEHGKADGIHNGQRKQR